MASTRKDQTSMYSPSNDRQVGGAHYKDHTGACPSCGYKLQHWDLVRIFNWDYFQGQITRYVMRWRNKNGVEDLRKADHYVEKYIEVAEQEVDECAVRKEESTTVDQVPKRSDVEANTSPVCMRCYHSHASGVMYACSYPGCNCDQHVSQSHCKECGHGDDFHNDHGCLFLKCVCHMRG